MLVFRQAPSVLKINGLYYTLKLIALRTDYDGTTQMRLIAVQYLADMFKCH